MNLAPAGRAIDMLAKPATLYRYGSGGWAANGEWIEREIGRRTTIQIKAVIQSPSEEDIRTLPEGERVEAYQTVWSRTELRTVDEVNGTEPDVILTPQGQQLRVTRVQFRAEAGFYRAICRLLGPSEGRPA